MISVQSLLARFVGKDDIRADLNHPMRIGDSIFATNGHVAVRVPLQDGVDALTPQRPLAIDQRFTEAKSNVLRVVELPALPDKKACKECEGTGRVKYVTCPSCDGSGSFDHEGLDYDCKLCNETGRLHGEGNEQTCDDCEGSGHDLDIGVLIDGHLFNLRYLLRIIDLPNLSFQVPVESNHYCMAYFTFDGGEGILMSMRA